MTSRIVIGDVHGCYKTLLKLVEQFPAGVPITFAGDLVDRGPDSKSVIDFVRSNGHDCVRGNHEELMVDGDMTWLMNGASQTIRSYSPERHIKDDDQFKTDVLWLQNLPYFIEYPEVIDPISGRYLVVSHSSVSRIWKDKEQLASVQKTHIIWNRQAPLDVSSIYNVFGHTPQELEPRVTKVYANVDTGCCYNDMQGLGILSAIQYPEMTIYQQENIEDES